MIMGSFDMLGAVSACLSFQQQNMRQDSTSTVLTHGALFDNVEVEYDANVVEFLSGNFRGQPFDMIEV